MTVERLLDLLPELVRLATAILARGHDPATELVRIRRSYEATTAAEDEWAREMRRKFPGGGP